MPTRTTSLGDSHDRTGARSGKGEPEFWNWSGWCTRFRRGAADCFSQLWAPQQASNPGRIRVFWGVTRERSCCDDPPPSLACVLWLWGSTADCSRLQCTDESGLSEKMRNAPTKIELKRAEGILEIAWGNEALRRYGVRQLRCECACAGCVDEVTGVRTLEINAVPEDIAITDMQLVGNYAVKFVFSDGHATGIYSWDRLYGMQSVQ